VVAHSDRRLDDLSPLTDTERQQMLVDLNATRSDYPAETCLHELFEAQAARTPEAIAIVFEPSAISHQPSALNLHPSPKDEGRKTKDEVRRPEGTRKDEHASFIVHRSSFIVQLTYAELDRRANQLAHSLQALGVGPDVPVGVYLTRSNETLVALLGILKAG